VLLNGEWCVSKLHCRVQTVYIDHAMCSRSHDVSFESDDAC